MQIKHSSTPYRATFNGVYWELRDADDEQIGDLCASSAAAPDYGKSLKLGEANAKFAERACNAYEELMAALEMCRWELNEMEKRTPGQEEALAKARLLLERQGIDGSANNG